MQPCDFHKTAEFLKDHTDEAHIRTSISRSYYGTFLYFREFFAKNGLRKQKQAKQDQHAFVCECLQYCQVREGTKAAVRIKNLLRWRTDADYYLEKTFSNKDSNDRLGEAKQTINNFKQAIKLRKTAEILKNATDYARQKDWI